VVSVEVPSEEINEMVMKMPFTICKSAIFSMIIRLIVGRRSSFLVYAESMDRLLK
jgi:hypothetical protein